MGFEHEDKSDFMERKKNREGAVTQLCENLDLMKVMAINSGDLKQLYNITMNIEKYCSQKYLPEPKEDNSYNKS